MCTDWPGIKKFEEELENNDPEHLKKFIDLLAKEKSLNRHMYSVLCECTYSGSESKRRWNLLHKFAENIFKRGK